MSSPLRLAYLVKKFPRLSETFVLGELLAQEELGGPVRVFARRAADDEPRHPQLARFRGEVEVVPSTRRIDPWRILFAEDAPPELLERLRDAVAALRRVGNQRIPELIAEALWLLDRTRALGIDHLHVHFATDAAVAAALLQALGGPTYSITAHAKDIYRETVSSEQLDWLVGGSAFTVTVCDANLAHMRSLVSAAAGERIVRLYNGIDLEDFTPVPSAGGHRDPLEILSVGRLVAKKGFGVLLDAFADLAARGVDFRATILGDGEEREQLTAQASALGLDGRVTFAGPQPQDVVREAMGRARVFCLPCVVGEDGNRDALPTVLLEAIASGLPCVSTPVTGIPEILSTPGAEGLAPAGLTVPERDAAATADALAQLLADDARCAALSAAGPERARRLFDRRRQGRLLRELFDGVHTSAPA